MNTLNIERLIIQHLMTWPQFDKSRTARNNINFTPPADGVWIWVSIQGGINMIASITDRPCIREVGQVSIEVFDRLNVGTGAAKQVADSLARHFSAKLIDELELQAASITETGVDGEFYRFNVTIPYFYR